MSLFESLLKKCFQAADFTQIALLGLDGAGKSTLLTRLRVPQWRPEKMIPALAELRHYHEWQSEDESPEWCDGKQYVGITVKDTTACVKEAGYNYETFFGKPYDYGVWDIPSIVPELLPPLWQAFYRVLKFHVIIYIVSSGDSRERVSLCRKHIEYLINEEELRDTVFVILINSKRDNPYDVQRDSMHYELGLHKLQGRDANRVRKFVVDVAGVKGVRDINWFQILDFIKRAQPGYKPGG